MPLGAHECIQEVNLAKLTLSTETLVASVNELTLSSRETNRLMQSMASQGTRIDSVEDRTSKTEHAVEGLYARVRAVELFQAKQIGTIEERADEEQATQNFRTTVKAMLAATLIIMAITAFLWLLNKNNYGFSTTETTTTTKEKR